jgi:predicted metal-dependent hydrolase
MKQESVKYGKRKIFYSVIYSNRKTLEIAVHPDGSVVITAPRNSKESVIREKVSFRAKWITKQIDYFKQFEPRTPPKQFLNGESHLYLGRRYRLKLLTGLREEVLLKNGYFIITLRNTEDRNKIKELLYNWYGEKAREKFNKLFKIILKNFRLYGNKTPLLKIRKMKNRWGSLSPNGTLSLNIELIKAPKESIEYVIAHELCHTIYHNHSRDFYKMLEEVMPDWGKRKQKLEIVMS